MQVFLTGASVSSCIQVNHEHKLMQARRLFRSDPVRVNIELDLKV